MGNIAHYIIAVMLLSAVNICTMMGQWSSDPTHNLIVGYGLNPEMCSDSAGGCYITHESGTVDYPRQLSLTRLNKYGYKPWGGDKLIRGVLPEQWEAKITTDGMNGVIVTYADDEITGSPESSVETSRLKVQRVDSSGQFLWDSLGVRVSLAETNQWDHAIISDGSNGCFVAWYDTLNRLWLQRINNVGQRMLGDSGVYVDASDSYSVWMVSDGKAGCFVYVEDGGGARFHRINESGVKVWAAGGVYVDAWGWPQIVFDNYGGIILAGINYISYNNGDPYYAPMCQRIDSNGTALWGTHGLTIADSIQYESLQSSKIDVVVYQDVALLEWGERIGQDTINIFTQGVRFDKTVLFNKPIKVSTVPSQSEVGSQWLVKSDSLKSIHLWMDSRTLSGCYTQMIDSNGNRLWNQNDIAVSIPSFTDMKTISDGNGGMILMGFYQYDFSVRAQQVSRTGNLGEIITSVAAKNSPLPDQFTLSQSYPNPANPSATLRYDLPTSSWVTLKVYDLLGREIATLVNGRNQPGEHSVTWNAANVPSGVYFYRLIAGDYVQTKKMVVMR